MDRKELFQRVEDGAKTEAVLAALATGSLSRIGKMLVAEVVDGQITDEAELQVHWDAGGKFVTLEGRTVWKGNCEDVVKEGYEQLVLFSPNSHKGEIVGAFCSNLSVARYVELGGHKISHLPRNLH